MDKEEWGPIIQHDGGPCPLPLGTVCRVFSPRSPPEGIIVIRGVTVVPWDMSREEFMRDYGPTGKYKHWTLARAQRGLVEFSWWEWVLDVLHLWEVDKYQVKRPEGMKKIDEVLLAVKVTDGRGIVIPDEELVSA